MKSMIIAALMVVGSAAMAIPDHIGNQGGPYPPYTGPECTHDMVMFGGSQGARHDQSPVYYTCVNGKLVDLYSYQAPAGQAYNGPECTRDVLMLVASNDGRHSQTEAYFACVNGVLVRQ